MKMRDLLWAERRKLRRSNILLIAFFAVIMVAIIVYAQGQFSYYGKRYVEVNEWYMTAALSLGSLYVLPAIIALTGTYIIQLEDQSDTMKSLAIVPVSLPRMIRAKWIVTAVITLALYLILFLITLTTEAILHFPLLTPSGILSFVKQYIIQGLSLFLAVSPIIALAAKMRKGYWLAFIFAEGYSFAALFVGMQPTISAVYPITAAFHVSGYYKTTPTQMLLSICSLAICGTLTVAIFHQLKQES